MLVALVTGKTVTPFDRLALGADAERSMFFRRDGASGLHIVIESLTGLRTLFIVCGLILATAFLRGNWRADLALILLGPLPIQKVSRRTQMLCAEVLIGLIAFGVFAVPALREMIDRYSPAWFHNLPDGLIVLAISFWATLAKAARVYGWRPFWARFFALFALVAGPASVVSQVYIGRDSPTDALASMFLGIALASLGIWCIEIFH